jgi:ribonucleoside-diphosphate reductase alpha chain
VSDIERSILGDPGADDDAGHPPSPQGLRIRCVSSDPAVHPFDQVEWARGTAEILDSKGRVIYHQDPVEFPKTWSQRAVNVTASKYFYGDASIQGPCREGGREGSLKDLLGRVCTTIARWGEADGYFATAEDADRFSRELTWLCLNQHAAFNSPVWFNVGLSDHYGIRGPMNNWRHSKNRGRAIACEDAYKYPQVSGCFIQSVEDNMGSIMDLAKSEAMLFKFGSGTGTDLSPLRSSREKIQGGGRPSGPVSFMRIYDATASVIKSGGKTRRAAKMQTLKVHHPDILEFIECKAKEDRKARVLMAAGWSDGMTGDVDEAYSSVAFQNTNLSVRATGDFFEKVAGRLLWQTTEITTGRPSQTYSAPMLLDRIAEGTWSCGDPGIQYEDTIQRWHTCPNTAPINSSNPCSEYMFIDDSACNLMSLNLMKFRRDDGSLDVGRFRSAVRIAIIAQEILVDRGSYPTEKIANNSHRFRPLGLGYANLGALIMSSGLPYDSAEGRTIAGAVTAILHGQAYLTSAEVAGVKGAFAGYEENRGPMLRVIKQHRDAAYDLWIANKDSRYPFDMMTYQATRVWDAVMDVPEERGYRNSQVTVLAPTGTIGFMMDCDTFGIEPAPALVMYKALAGGGIMRIVNERIPDALRALRCPDGTQYGETQIGEILAYIDEHDTIEGAPGLLEEDLPVFDCAFPPPRGGRSISWRGHVEMMAAVQPFLSGAISKTVNMPADATVAEIRDAYLLGHRLGLKALAIYRDGSKGVQPLTTKRIAPGMPLSEAIERAAAVGADIFIGVDPAVPNAEYQIGFEAGQARSRPRRERLPATRRSLTHKFKVGDHEGYVNVGFYPDGRVGEVFVTMSKEGSTLGGLMDALGTFISVGLQYGVPLEVVVSKLAHTRFEPNGLTGNPDIPLARSITDYIGQWLGMEFLEGYRERHATRREPAADPAAEPTPIGSGHKTAREYRNGKPLAMVAPIPIESDAPPCHVCGAAMTRVGPCYSCPNCFATLGSCG